ncbi:MAG: hydantoinase B/oxoprolinase family protein [Chloroflexi bacterium]|nr:hydantoinase B/oxoprolinase family protein [Chloroflexota bacterium]MBV9603112.1 hydantoinase B/oxoprolinase family protein [Chloroflexota bacterium]
MTHATAADAITLEVMRNALYSIADEMTAGLVHASYWTNIKDRRDCSCALYTTAGEVVAMGEWGGTPLHLGTMHSALDTALEAFPPETLRPGDALILNSAVSGRTWSPERRVHHRSPVCGGSALRICGKPGAPRRYRRLCARQHAIRRHRDLPGGLADHPAENPASRPTGRTSAGVHQSEPANAGRESGRFAGADRGKYDRPAAGE